MDRRGFLSAALMAAAALFAGIKGFFVEKGEALKEAMHYTRLD